MSSTRNQCRMHIAANNHDISVHKPNQVSIHVSCQSVVILSYPGILSLSSLRCPQSALPTLHILDTQPSQPASQQSFYLPSLSICLDCHSTLLSVSDTIHNRKLHLQFVVMLLHWLYEVLSIVLLINLFKFQTKTTFCTSWCQIRDHVNKQF